MEINEKITRRNFLTASALAGASLFGLNGLEAQIVETELLRKNKEEDTGSIVLIGKDHKAIIVGMNYHYHVGLFLCNGWNSKNYKSVILEDFIGVNKGAKIAEIGIVREASYKKDENLNLVIYNPERKNHKNLGIYVSEVVEEEGIKFIDGKPYEVKLRKGKIIERKPFIHTTEKNLEGNPFYELFREKLDILHPSKFEEVIRKGPFELNGNHKSLNLKLKPGTYNTLLELYEGNKPTASMANVGVCFRIVE